MSTLGSEMSGFRVRTPAGEFTSSGRTWLTGSTSWLPIAPLGSGRIPPPPFSVVNLDAVVDATSPRQMIRLMVHPGSPVRLESRAKPQTRSPGARSPEVDRRRSRTVGWNPESGPDHDGRGTTHPQTGPCRTQRLQRRDTCRVDRRRPYAGDPARPAPELPVARARRTATGAEPEASEHGNPMGCAPGRNRGAPLRAPRATAANVAGGSRTIPEDHLDTPHHGDDGEGGDSVRAGGVHPARRAAGSKMPGRPRG